MQVRLRADGRSLGGTPRARGGVRALGLDAALPQPRLAGSLLDTCAWGRGEQPGAGNRVVHPKET